jgi:hypothetical protein
VTGRHVDRSHTKRTGATNGPYAMQCVGASHAKAGGATESRQCGWRDSGI